MEICEKYQSDVIVDLLKLYGIEYIAINPGASFRGLHDSIVNYGDNQPPLLLCQHEETAVQMAHGYARATGKPMAVILHDVVGMLHAQMAIYYASTDRTPILILGATGPMDERYRRPRSDWHHTAQIQGEALRNFSKYDYQPHTVEGIVDSFMRGWSSMVSEPQGPVYLCYDAVLQEQQLVDDVDLPDENMQKAPTPMAADPDVLEQMVATLLRAEHPWIMTEYSGRHPGNFEKLVQLAELIGVAVWDINSALCFPNRHPLNLSMDKNSLRDADVILALDVTDWEKATVETDSTSRLSESILKKECVWMELGVHETGINSWSLDYGRYLKKSLSALADSRQALSDMSNIAERLLRDDKRLTDKVHSRKQAISLKHQALVAGWEAEADAAPEGTPVVLPRLAAEVWKVIQDEDWVLACGTLRQWTRKLWNFDKPYRHPGKSIGTSTQIGMSLGVALAHKNSDKVVVTIQPDGDLMYDAGALWTAAKHELPLLIIMFNNRAYYNDWHHQIRVADHRGTDRNKAHIGMDLDNPAVDFATVAQGMGMFGIGPIESSEGIEPALREALAVVKSGKPALVDIITTHR